jgi:uncharacterized protein
VIPPPSPRRACLVTGASSGLGAAFARALAARGHGLSLTARRADRLQTLAGELRERWGTPVSVHPCDLGSEADRRALIDAVAGEGRAIEVLVNNAGFALSGPFAGQDSQLLEVMRVNGEAPAHLCETYVPGMVARGRGAILNVSSIAAFAPLPSFAAYAAAKTLVLNLTLALHAELRHRGVTVTALAPGAMRTEFAEVSGTASLAAGIPGRLWSPPERVAEAGLRGLDRGQPLVVVGVAYRALAMLAHHTPRRPLLATLARASARGWPSEH